MGQKRLKTKNNFFFFSIFERMVAKVRRAMRV